MYIADLHIHSRYSRATSRELTPEQLDLEAGKKGIHLLGTGDFTIRPDVKSCMRSWSGQRTDCTA